METLLSKWVIPLENRTAQPYMHLRASSITNNRKCTTNSSKWSQPEVLSANRIRRETLSLAWHVPLRFKARQHSPRRRHEPQGLRLWIGRIEELDSTWRHVAPMKHRHSNLLFDTRPCQCPTPTRHPYYVLYFGHYRCLCRVRCPCRCRCFIVLHTLCGTPTYMAPEILTRKGYDGASMDVWLCSIVLFALDVGYLPFL